MKKVLLVSTLSLALGTSVFSKEIIQEPIVAPEVVEEVPVQNVVVETPVVENKQIEDKKLNHLYFKVGGNVYSKYSTYKYNDLKISNGKTKDFGYEIAIEGTRNITDNFELGLGLAYQGNNKHKDYTVNEETFNVGKYDSVPLYLTGKYNFDTTSNWKPYLKANLGYSFNINEKDGKYSDVGQTYTESYKLKVKNGLYAGVGAGIEYNNFLADLTYSINCGKATLTNKEYPTYKTKSKKLDFGKVTLSIGYKLDI